MNIIDEATGKYQASIQQPAQQPAQPPTPAQMAEQAGLKIGNPQAAQKINLLAGQIAQQAAQGAKIQQADGMRKAITNYKQSVFAGKV